NHLYQALKAQSLYQIDVDYVIQDGEVKIVDEFTGRIMEGRRWSEGLHQAVEAKEGVKIQEEHQTLATITLQNYFRLYEKLAAMTSSAPSAPRRGGATTSRAAARAARATRARRASTPPARTTSSASSQATGSRASWSASRSRRTSRWRRRSSPGRSRARRRRS